jgi:O-succinylbenzoate synthase
MIPVLKWRRAEKRIGFLSIMVAGVRMGFSLVSSLPMVTEEPLDLHYTITGWVWLWPMTSLVRRGAAMPATHFPLKIENLAGLKKELE